MVVNGGLSHCCFNGPTSRNVAGIYWLSDVYCYSFPLGIVAVSPLSILGVPHRLAGAQHLVSKLEGPNPLVWEPQEVWSH